MIGTIAQYTLLKEIGSGVFGTVFLAVGDVPGRGRNALSRRRVVAIKKLNDMNNLESKELLIQEFSLLDQVKHRCIVRVFEYLEKENAVVMEYIHGTTLRHIIDSLVEKRERMFTEAAIEIACEIADGLYQAYTIPGDNGEPLHLVHRDLKPANIMLTTTGEVKILDFGLARVDNSELLIDDSDKIRGTPIYMAPEQAQGLGVDHRTDLYSLALMLYEMLMGSPAYRIPIDSSDPVQALMKDVSAARFDFDPHRLSKELPVIGDMITRCLQKNPKHRYPNGQEIVVDLRRQLMREQGEYLVEFTDFCFETIVEISPKPSMAEVDKILKEAASNSLSSQLRMARHSVDTPRTANKEPGDSKTVGSDSTNKLKYIQKIKRPEPPKPNSGEPMAKGPKRPPVGGGASRQRPSNSPRRVEGAKSPDATGMLNFVPIDAEDGGEEDEASATQFFAIPKPPQSSGGPRNVVNASNPNLNAPPPPGGGFAPPPPTGGFAPPPPTGGYAPPPPPGGIGQGGGIGAGGIGSGGRGPAPMGAPFNQAHHTPVAQGNPQSGQVGTQRVYVILGVVMFLILLIVAVTVYISMGKKEEPKKQEKIVQKSSSFETEPSSEEEEEEEEEEKKTTKKKRKKKRTSTTTSRPKKEKPKKKKDFRGGSMTVTISGDYPGSAKLSGCGRGKKMGKRIVFQNVSAGKRCQLIIGDAAPTTFTASDKVKCSYSAASSGAKCR